MVYADEMLEISSHFTFKMRKICIVNTYFRVYISARLLVNKGDYCILL